MSEWCFCDSFLVINVEESIYNYVFVCLFTYVYMMYVNLVNFFVLCAEPNEDVCLDLSIEGTIMRHPK